MSNHWSANRTRRVLVVQRVVAHYRVRFWQLVSERLRHLGIELLVAHGQEFPGTAPQSVGKGGLGIRGERWAPNTYLQLCGKELILQRNARHADGADLVIVEQATRLAFTWRCMLWHHLRRGPRVALWGHGRSWQGSANSIGEIAKRRLLRQAHFWFAYTDEIADDLTDIAPERIINVGNAIDTRSLAQDLTAVRQRGIDRIPGRVAFIGSMRSDKRLQVLFEAADGVRVKVADFSIDFIGDGPEREQVQAFCSQRDWARYLGPLFNEKKAKALAQAQYIVNPGLVGLNILDAFVAEAPLITTDYPGHSPEIAYLERDTNGLMSTCDPKAYAACLVDALGDANLASRLRQGCRIAAKRYSIERMALNFTLGIVRALARPRIGGPPPLSAGPP